MAPLDVAFLLQLLVGPADGVRVQAEAAGHVARAGQALASTELSRLAMPSMTCVQICSRRRDFAGMDEPEAHGWESVSRATENLEWRAQWGRGAYESRPQRSDIFPLADPALAGGAGMYRAFGPESELMG